MTVINTNVRALYTQQALKKSEIDSQNAMQSLSTGKRINGAKDDAAGMAIVSRMTTQVRGLDQAIRNANDGISMLQTADGAMEEVSNMLQRMRELSVQYKNDTNGTRDLAALSTEFTALNDEISRINNQTLWNGEAVFGSSGDLQVGANSGDTIQFSVDSLSIAATVGQLDTLDTDIDTLNTSRSNLGALINRLSYAANNAMNVSQNTNASRSLIQDTDYATASTELARTQIMTQAGTAVLAQANTSQQAVLKLLQG
jgi:flagellin